MRVQLNSDCFLEKQDSMRNIKDSFLSFRDAVIELYREPGEPCDGVWCICISVSAWVMVQSCQMLTRLRRTGVMISQVNTKGFSPDHIFDDLSIQNSWTTVNFSNAWTISITNSSLNWKPLWTVSSKPWSRSKRNVSILPRISCNQLILFTVSKLRMSG